MSLRITFLFLFFSIFTYSQNSYFVDSLDLVIKNYSKKEQLQKILNIPYDKFIGNITTSEKLSHKAVDLSKELNDIEALAEAYLLLAQVYAYQDKREKKIIFRLNAIKIFEEISKLDRAGYAYAELGFSIRREDFEKGLFYMRKGLKLIEKSNEQHMADAAFDNYGIVQGMLHNYDSAVYYHKKSLRIKKQNNDSIGIPYGYVHLATVNINLSNFTIAKKYIDSAHVIRLKRKDTYGITDNFAYYGDLYFAQNDFHNAVSNFKKGYDSSIRNNYKSLQKYCAEYLTKSYVAQKDFENAFNYNYVFQSLKDSTLNVQTNHRVAELQIEFDTEKKEKEIAQQKEQLLKNELQLKNRNLFMLLLGSGVLILGIVIFGLFKRSKHKRKEFQHNLALKEAQTYSKLQDQRLRISRDLHDNIGSQLTFIISSIDNLKFLTKDSNENLKNKLTDINSFASNTISQLRDTIWAMNKTEITFENLLSRVISFIEKAKSAKNDISFCIENNVKSNPSFSSIKGINIFRVIQESVHNAIKYSRASEIEVQFFENTTRIIITISDNGIGFNKNEVELGNGLENMENRIKEVGALLSITSEKNKGTIISITCNKNKTNAV